MSSSATHNEAVQGADTKSSAARSCTTCAKAKAKCVRIAGQNICGRCARLRKDCYLREPVARRRKAVKQSRAAQLEKLESKLENLVNALSTQQARQQIGHEYGQPSPPASSVSTGDRSESRADSGVRPGPRWSQLDSTNGVEMTGRGHQHVSEQDQQLLQQSNSGQYTTGSHSAGPSPGASIGDSTPSSICSASSSTSISQPTALQSFPEEATPLEKYLGVSIMESEILLDRYRRLMSPFMPFVPLPEGTSSRRIYTHRPVLLHAICAVASFDNLEKQQQMVKDVVRDIGERIMFDGQKSVDLLQAILVLCTWYHPHIHKFNQLTVLLHLAIAMIKDLNLDRVQVDCEKYFGKPPLEQAVERPSLHTQRKAASLQEHRCLAGMFYLTSSFACSFKKADAIKYTPYLENCLKTLHDAREYESDLVLVQMIRLQHICEEVHAMEAPGAPVQLHAKAFHAEIEHLKRIETKTGPELNLMLEIQYLITEISIWELSLIDLQETRSTFEYIVRPRSAVRRTPRRCHLDDMYKCAQAVRRYLDVYFSIPPETYMLLSFPIFGQCAHAFVLAIRFASLAVEGWDFQALGTELNIKDMLEDAASRFEASVSAKPDGIPIKNEMFTKYAHRMRWLKSVYESRIGETDRASEQSRKVSEHALHFNTVAGKTGDQRQQQEHQQHQQRQYQHQQPAPQQHLSDFHDHQQHHQHQQQAPLPPPLVLTDDILSGDFFSYMDENFWNSFAIGDIDFAIAEMSGQM